MFFVLRFSRNGSEAPVRFVITSPPWSSWLCQLSQLSSKRARFIAMPHRPTTGDFACMMYRLVQYCVLLVAALLLPSIASATALNDAPVDWKLTQSTAEGLPSKVVLNFFQDSQGFMWISTEAGLSRFDGYHYQSYFTNRTDGLTGNYSWAAAEDNKGDLFFATDDGEVVVFRRQSAQFEPLTLRDAEGPLKLGNVLDLAISAEGHLWLASQAQGVIKATRSGEVLAVVGREALGFSGRERQLREIWIGAETTYALVMDGGLYAISRMDHSVTALKPQTADFAPTAMWLDSDERLIVATRSGKLFESATPGDELLPAGSLPNSYSSWVRRLYRDNGGRLWVGTNSNGLFVREFEGAPWIHFGAGKEKGALPASTILDIFQDRSGALWFGTRGTGYFQWLPQSLVLGARQPEGYAKSHFMGFAERPDGEIWAATWYSGVLRLSAEGDVIGPLSDLKGLDNLPDHATCITRASDGSVYFGTSGEGVFRVYPDNRVVQIPTPEQQGRMAGVMSLHVLGQRLLIGTYDAGVLAVDAESNMPVLDFVPSQETGLAQARVTTIHSAGNELWIGTEKSGLYLYDLEARTLQAWSPRELAGVDSVAIYDVATVGDSVGVATDSEGVLLLRRSSGGWHFQTRIDRDSGLQSNAVYGIESVSAQQTWLSTQHGIAKLTLPSLRVDTFEALAGSSGTDFVFGAHAQLQDGRLLFGSTEGYNLFSPSDLELDAPTPHIALTSIEKLNRNYDPVSLLQSSKELHLGYADDVVSFEFAVLDFIDPSANTFRHRLRGFEDQWSQATTRNFVTYTNLSAGHYVLEVQGFNALGEPSEPYSLSIHVTPPPWQTIWAYLSYAFLAASIIWLFLKWRFREQEREARINQLAYYDQVTGIPNRYLFEARADAALTQAIGAGESFSVLWLRVVLAPQMSDLLNPEQRDEVARALAGRCVRIVHGGFDEPGKRDVARMESLGFAVFVRDQARSEQAQALAERLVNVLGQPLTVAEQLVPIAAHIGLAAAPDDGDKLSDLMTYAQAATFDPGPRQQSRIVRYQASMTQTAAARVSLESRLREALAQSMLQVYFQPRLNQDGRITGAEALLRWPVTDGPWPSPAEFVPLAEQSELIGVLDRYVLRQVCIAMQRWAKQGIPAIPIAINMSARSLGPDDLVEDLQALCVDHGISADSLEIELTESAVVADMERVRRSLEALQRAGCKISLDDFGTGYSSLSHLQAFAIDCLKIDRSFVAEVDAGGQPASICQGIVSLAQGLGMRVVAEGVETQAQWDTLKKMGCPEMQGFLFSPAVPASELAAMLVEPMTQSESQR